jgi:isoamylase
MAPKVATAQKIQPVTRPSTWAATHGMPTPLGVSRVAAQNAYNFAIYSKNATKVSVLLYSATDLTTPIVKRDFDQINNRTGRVWHTRIADTDVNKASYYAYSIDGPLPTGKPHEWHAFKAAKILLDPYATAVYFPPAYDRAAALGSGSNVAKAPLGVLPKAATEFDWTGDIHPQHESDLVIYEMHLRGFTRNPNSGVDADKAGTYLGVIDKIPHLKELGVTAVELMPIYEFDDTEPNAWGYQPINFFSPHSHYASRDGKQIDEFRQMVKALHAAGIEVLLDVVYNHTGEGNENGPTFSFKGIDNSTYYMDSPDPNNPYPYVDYTGTGNTLHTANAAVRQLVVESLRYWARDMHVDGFRFDLAAVFTHNDDGSMNFDDPAVFGDIATDPDLSGRRMIAEPWDVSSTGYVLGRKFPGSAWRQWNDQFRNTLRHFVKSDSGFVPDLMTRLYGSADVFPDTLPDVCHPYQSLNYVVSHDGPTLYDLVAYNSSDGWNCGQEGEMGVSPAVMQLRKQQVKNFCTLLMLANGTPMIRMGDEILQTQNGQWNPYNVDDPSTWMDWDRQASHSDVFRFFSKMIAFRKAHPSLARDTFWHDDVKWYGVSNSVDLSADSHTLAYCLHGASQNDDDVYVMINAYWEPLTFTVQEGLPEQWTRVADTSLASPQDIVDAGTSIPSLFYTVAPRSVVVLTRSSS